MRRFLGVALLIFVAVAGWRIGELLSTDALGMALGVLFGMMAGIPAALIALSASRMQHPQPSREDRPSYEQARYGMMPASQGMPPYPPVIVVAGAQHGQQMLPQQQQGYAMPMQMPRIERNFKIMGEEDGWVE